MVWLVRYVARSVGIGVQGISRTRSYLILRDQSSASSPGLCNLSAVLFAVVIDEMGVLRLAYAALYAHMLYCLLHVLFRSLLLLSTRVFLPFLEKSEVLTLGHTLKERYSTYFLRT